MENDRTKLFPEWKELVKVAETWEYGTFHSHDEIAEIIGVDAQTPKYYGIVAKAKSALIERRKLLGTRFDKGYFVIEIKQFDEEIVVDIKKSKTILERGLKKML